MRTVKRIIYWCYRWISGTRYWARRRFTVAGLAVALGVLFSAAVGSDMEQTVVYRVFVLLFTWLVVSFVACLFFRGRFMARRQLPRFGSVGEPLLYSVFLRNDSGRAQAGLLLQEHLADPRPTFDEFVTVLDAESRQTRSFSLDRRSSGMHFERARIKEAPVPRVAPGQEVEVRLELTPLRRGVLRWDGLAVARPDPFGLVKALVRLALPQSILILPRRYPLRDLALPGVSQYQQGGVALASSVGESEEFVSLRDYRPGDPLRHIHWRSWARAGTPIVKEFEDEFFVRHALILDTFTGHPNSAAFEEAVSVAASFACTVPNQESLLDLLFVGAAAYCFTAGRGLAHTEQLLEILASVQICAEPAFDRLAQLVVDHVRVVSGCVCVLLAWDEPRRGLVRKLKEMGIPLRVLVVVEAGAEAPTDLGPLADQPESFRVLEAGRAREGLLNL